MIETFANANTRMVRMLHTMGASEEPREIGYQFGLCLPFLDPSNELVGPLDQARIVGLLDKLTGDAGDGISGGGVTDLSDGATTVMEVRRNFGETPNLLV